jgi:hypothetical protein
MPKERPKPQRVWCTTSRPHGDDVGAIAEGHYLVEKGVLKLCAADGGNFNPTMTPGALQ